MEDTLRVMKYIIRLIAAIPVLILVVMEDTLRAKIMERYYVQECLNPCCNGRYSQRITLTNKNKKIRGLNPCCNGRYSQSIKDFEKCRLNACLNPCSNGRYSQSSIFEDDLIYYCSLNPCSNGRYSQRARHTNPLYKRDWYL